MTSFLKKAALNNGNVTNFASCAASLNEHAAHLDRREAHLIDQIRKPISLNPSETVELANLLKKPCLNPHQQAEKARLERKQHGSIPLDILIIWTDQARVAKQGGQGHQEAPLLEKVWDALNGKYGYIVHQRLTETELQHHISELRSKVKENLGHLRREAQHAKKPSRDRHHGFRDIRHGYTTIRYEPRVSNGRRLGGHSIGGG